jgi:uncharacterized membrane protein YfcA
VGAAANARQGTLDARLALGFGAAGIGGALAGSALNRLASGETVLFMLAIVMLASARALWRGRPEAPGEPVGSPARRAALVGALGLGVGVLTGFFGVGGGFIIVPVLIVLLGVPVRAAIGTSLMVIAMAATAGLLGHLGAGGVSLPLVAAFAGAGMAGSLLGVRAGRSVGTEILSRAFALLLVGLAVALLAANAAAVGL